MPIQVASFGSYSYINELGNHHYQFPSKQDKNYKPKTVIYVRIIMWVVMYSVTRAPIKTEQM